MSDQRPWNTARALRVALFEYYSDAHESWANRDARRAVEGYTKFDRPETLKEWREKNGNLQD